MPWIWRPFLGPVWISEPGTKENNKRNKAGLGKSTGSNAKKARSPNSSQSVEKPGELEKSDRVRVNYPVAANGKSKPKNPGEKHVEKEDKVFIGSMGQKKNCGPVDSVENEEPGINEGKAEFEKRLEQSIERQFDEVQPGVFQFKLPQVGGVSRFKENANSMIKKPEVPAAIPSSMNGFTIIGYTKEGLPVYTMR